MFLQRAAVTAGRRAATSPLIKRSFTTSLVRRTPSLPPKIRIPSNPRPQEKLLQHQPAELTMEKSRGSKVRRTLTTADGNRGDNDANWKLITPPNRHQVRSRSPSSWSRTRHNPHRSRASNWFRAIGNPRKNARSRYLRYGAIGCFSQRFVTNTDVPKNRPRQGGMDMG